MSEPIIGSIDNGSVGEATIGAFTGPVGIARVAGSDVCQLAFKGSPEKRRPIDGMLDGVPVKIIGLRRSDFDARIMIATVRPAG